MSNIANTQSDPVSTARAVEMKPHEYYNKYIRQEGQKVYTEKEYEELVKQRSFTLKGRMGNDIAAYPLTPKESYASTDTGKSD